MTFDLQVHAFLKRESNELNPRERWSFYVCRCGKAYHSLQRWGWASRNEARQLHREHLERIANGTENIR